MDERGGGRVVCGKVGDGKEKEQTALRNPFSGISCVAPAKLGQGVDIVLFFLWGQKAVIKWAACKKLDEGEKSGHDHRAMRAWMLQASTVADTSDQTVEAMRRVMMPAAR